MTIHHEYADEAVEAAAMLLATVDVIAMESDFSNEEVLQQIITAARIKHAEGIAAFCRERIEIIN